jgi:hypothetical protein
MPPDLESPVAFMATQRPHFAHRPSLLLSYNDQSLPHEAELARRRHLAYERSQRAAAEALRTLRAEREHQHGSSQNAVGSILNRRRRKANGCKANCRVNENDMDLTRK